VNAAQSLDWLYASQLHGIRLGLDNIHRLLSGLGVDFHSPAAPRFLHVAGTNGKGSVCALLAAALRESGLRTGLYTSPHLVTFRERIQINGDLLSEHALAKGLTKIRDLTDSWDSAPTFFEIVTALALAHFQENDVHVAVLETGLGGRLDATNVVTPAVSVITPIDLDHQAWLGDSLTSIASEKAGIFKPGIPAISAPQPEEAAQALRLAALQRGTPIEFITHPYSGPVGLQGSHQPWNAALAARALALSQLPTSPSAIAEGFRTVQWPGRFHAVTPHLILDGAHNPAAAHRLALTWRETFGDTGATLILAMMRDKDAAGFCRAIAPIATRILTIGVQNERSLSAEAMATLWRENIPHIPATPMDSLSAALQRSTSHPERALVTGSLFLVGEALVETGIHAASGEHGSQ